MTIIRRTIMLWGLGLGTISCMNPVFANSFSAFNTVFLLTNFSNATLSLKHSENSGLSQWQFPSWINQNQMRVARFAYKEYCTLQGKCFFMEEMGDANFILHCPSGDTENILFHTDNINSNEPRWVVNYFGSQCATLTFMGQKLPINSGESVLLTNPRGNTMSILIKDNDKK